MVTGVAQGRKGNTAAGSLSMTDAIDIRKTSIFGFDPPDKDKAVWSEPARRPWFHNNLGVRGLG